MPKTYAAILKGDRVEWVGDRPPDAGAPVKVRITVLSDDLADKGAAGGGSATGVLAAGEDATATLADIARRGGGEHTPGADEPSIGGGEHTAGADEPSIGGGEHTAAADEPSIGGGEHTAAADEPSNGWRKVRLLDTLDALAENALSEQGAFAEMGDAGERRRKDREIAGREAQIKMPAAIAQHADELTRLCAKYNVLRLEVFGSAASGAYRPGDSDLDFLVEFRPLSPGAYADAYFGLLGALERLFGCPVDLVVPKAIKNPYFLESVNQTRTLVYEA